MYSQLERYIPLFQGYLISNNKQQFISCVKDPTERCLFEVVTGSIDDFQSFKQKLVKSQISFNIRESLLVYKLAQYIKNTKHLNNQNIKNQIKKMFQLNQFDYPRPSNVTNQVASKEHAPSLSHVIEDNLEEYLKTKLYANPANIRQFNDYAISRLNEKQLFDLPLSEKQYLLEKCGIIFHFSQTFISKFLMQYETQKRKTAETYRLNNKVLSYLTKTQLIQLGNLNPSIFHNQDYIELWFNQLFSQRISQAIQGSQYFSPTQHLEKRESLLSIISELSSKSQHLIIKSYVNKLNSQILVLDVYVNDPQIDRLINYLSSSHKVSQISNIKREYSKQLNEKFKTMQIKQPKMRFQLQVDKLTLEKVIEDYLETLFTVNQNNQQSIKRLTRFYEEEYLRKLNAKISLFKGESNENATNYFTQSEIQSLREKREIRLLRTNNKKFKIEDDVSLQINIKNVNTMRIKIYQLNLQKHLLNNSSDIDDQINLSFLKPTHQIITNFQYKTPYQVKKEIIDLKDYIPKTMGVYIVDLQGETVTSRAIIRKGKIICIDELTEAGQKFSFYDQNGRPLTKQSGLKIWIKKRQVELTSNYILLKYEDSSRYDNIVASMGSYAQSYLKSFEGEEYQFDIGFIYNPQSFIVGKKAKILLHPRLKLNKNTMSVQLLKKTIVKVNVTNNQKIKTFYSFDIKQWSNFSDRAIQFPIQSYIANINIVVQTEILLQNGKTKNFSISKDINIDLRQSNQNFCDFYLEKNSKYQYILNLLGLNGEKISNTQVNISYNVNGVDEVQKKIMKFNENGQINLGPLSIIKKLSASLNISGVLLENCWQIDQTQSNFNYTKTIYHKIGQELTLPINPNWTRNDIVFLRTFDKYYVSDQSKSLIIEKGLLKLPIIHEQGFYVLKLLPIQKNIQILTLKNIKWQGDNEQNQKVYDQDEGKVYEIKKNSYQSIHIKNISFKEQNNYTRANIALDLSGVPENKKKFVRVHVYANNYFTPEYSNLFDSEALSVQSKFKEHNVQIKRSAYYSNKNLSQEGSYVWNRQRQQNKLIGNNLQKPSIFLKRIFVSQTRQTDEQLDQEDDYEQQCALIHIDPNTRKKLESMRARRCNRSLQIKRIINSHNNFLSLTGQLQANLKGQQNIQIDIPHGYNSIEILVLTPQSSIKKIFALGSDIERSTINLTHGGLQQTSQNRGWTMSRQIYKIRSGQQQNVSRNSQWKVVSMQQIFEFANTKKIRLYDWSNDLLNWHTYNEEKKKQIYDKQCCHELNTFIKFKDPIFFQNVVSRFMRNKIAKTFVDLCLLEDESVCNYLKINQFNQLNAFQKVLLVYYLSKQNKQQMKNIAKNIVHALELQQKSIKRNYQNFKNNFDTIINAQLPELLKSLSSNKLSQPGLKFAKKCAEPFMIQKKYFQCEEMSFRLASADEKKPFVPIESTKQYAQRTYYNVKNYNSEAPYLISASPFWAQLSRFILQGNTTNFLSQQFMSFSKPIQFILSASFISCESSVNFQLSNIGENYKINTKVPLLIYVKEVKQLQHTKKYAVLINQRFFDPNNMMVYEQDGTLIQKQAQEFISKKPYICQTVVNNTSGTNLQLQILLDIPKGTIPLLSHQYTQIVNVSMDPYTSKKFERYFYAPKQGVYPIYPSNASKGSVIIAKASKLPNIVVQKVLKTNKLQSFGDFLRSGNKDSIIQFIKQKNIFDKNIFNVKQILWMLKDKDFYYKVINVLKQRTFYDYDIWNFGFFHEDIDAIRQIISFKNKNIFQCPVFQYFPYYSSRTHQFANQNKSTIRNVQFKQTYIRFLLYSVINIEQKSAFYASFAYYLILQDRLKEAQNIINLLTNQQYKAHEIQFDYMKCFLDLSLNAPNFSSARDIIKKYKDYPLSSWAKLFEQVRKTIEAEDEQVLDYNEKNEIQQFETQVIQQIGQFKIIKPAQTQIVVQFFELNLQLYFSEYPFYQLKTFTSIKPSRINRFSATDKTQEIVIKRSDYNGLKDASVQITAYKNGLQPKKVTNFSWNNPDIKVKINQNLGNLQVFINKKRAAGSYIKVFAERNQRKQFYRDGYTDMTGTFRYAMSDLDGIKEFSILISTEVGGTIHKVKPPSKLASY